MHPRGVFRWVCHYHQTPPLPADQAEGVGFLLDTSKLEYKDLFKGVSELVSFPICAVSSLEPSKHDALFVKLLSPNATLPKQGSEGAAGYDLSSATEMVVPANGKAAIPTDLAIATPPGTYARLAPRSGLAIKNFLAIGAGVVDPDFRGNIKVVIFNHSPTDFLVKRGDRIAQLILEQFSNPPVALVSDLPDTKRGSDGFGSTGLSSDLVSATCGSAVTPPIITPLAATPGVVSTPGANTSVAGVQTNRSLLCNPCPAPVLRKPTGRAGGQPAIKSSALMLLFICMHHVHVRVLLEVCFFLPVLLPTP